MEQARYAAIAFSGKDPKRAAAWAKRIAIT